MRNDEETNRGLERGLRRIYWYWAILAAVALILYQFVH